MTVYVKSLSKTKEADDREKGLPVSNLGSTMISHGEDFENDSEFGSCLIGMSASHGDGNLKSCLACLAGAAPLVDVVLMK